MKKLISIATILSLTALVACQPAGPSADAPSARIAGIPEVDYVSLYRDNLKSTAEAFEALEASVTLNPCLDTFTGLTSSGTNGTFSVNSNHEFNFVDMGSAPFIASECNLVLPVPDNATAGKKGIISNTTGTANLSGDFTVIMATKAVATTILTTRGTAISVIQGDGAFGAYVSIEETNNTTTYYSRTEFKDLAGAPSSVTVASFSIDRGLNKAEVFGYNSKLGEFMGTEVLHPSATASESGDVGDFDIKELGITLNKGQNQGLLYLAVFPKILSEEERKMMMCYGMFSSAVNGNLELLENYASVCAVQ